MFLIVFCSVLALDGLFWWWADRRARRLPRARLWRVGIALFLGLQLLYVLALFAVPGFRHVSHHYVPPWALGIMYIWHLLVLPVWAVLAGACGLGRLAVSSGRHLASRTASPQPHAEDEQPATGAAAAIEPALSRRQLLTAAAIAAPPLITFGLTGIGIARLNEFRTRHLDVALAGLPPALDGLRIAHVSDIHVGRYTRGRILRQIADATKGSSRTSCC